MTIPSAQPFFPEEDVKEILADFEKVLRGKLSLGPYLQAFETEFSKYIGCAQSVAVHSATNALEICMRYFDLNGAEVIVPADTFVATANAVVLSGGVPVIADIDAETLCLSLDTIKSRVTEKTKGIVIVHMMGLITPELDVILDFCTSKGLFLIEDAAHAHGASINGKKAGSLGDAGCFSFYPTRVLTSAEGGMITTDDPGLAAFARSFRHHGVDASGSGSHSTV